MATEIRRLTESEIDAVAGGAQKAQPARRLGEAALRALERAEAGITTLIKSLGGTPGKSAA